jgi:hypothetical protein
MAPVPLFAGVASGLLPVAGILMLSGVCVLVMLLEGTQGAVGVLFLLLFAQAVAYLMIWLGVAVLAARLLARLPRRVAGALVVTALVAGVLLTSTFPLYRTPFRAASTQARFLEQFE